MWEGVYESTRPSDYITGSVASDGTFTGSIGPCPEGFCWYVERTTCYSNTAAGSPVLELYVTNTEGVPPDNSKRGRQDVATAATVKNAVSDNNSAIFVPPGYFLVAHWSAANSGDVVSLSAQIRVHRLTALREAIRDHQTGGAGVFMPTGPLEEKASGDHLGRLILPGDERGEV